VKVYLKASEKLSRAMGRVAHWLTRYAPATVTIVTDAAEADLVILHAVGFDETIAAIEVARQRKQRYAILQYCLRSTQRPTTHEWIDLWVNAVAVWSYYDLPQLCKEDRTTLPHYAPLYVAPLGVDSTVFMFDPDATAKTHLMLTSGYVAETEGVREAAAAALRVGGRNIHLGPDLALGRHVDCVLDISDAQLARFYRRCQFVAGLRRVEGFELPAAEGLRCGARPVMFDTPHYRRWFDGLVEFVPEGPPEQLTNDLERLFREGARPVTREEAAEARWRFDWQRLCDGFWTVALGHQHEAKYA
jgi:hypothetical protein